MLDPKVTEQARLQAERVISEMKEGTRTEGIEFADEVVLKEMIGTADGGQEFVEKITYDLYQGREGVPLLYKSFYTELSDPNFPETILNKQMGPVEVVFLEKFEGGEVKFGVLAPGQPKLVKFSTYAAGVEYDEDMLEYNQTWRVTEIGLAFGEAYNKLLNNLYFTPIISGTYATTGMSIAAQKVEQEKFDNGFYTGIAQLIAYNASVRQTLKDAIAVLPRGTVILANPADRYAIEDAIYGDIYTDLKTPGALQRQIDPTNIIYYDGEVVQVGGKEYDYAGVPAGTCFLLVPNKQFVEYTKHELRVDSNDGDLSRLVVTQVVGRARKAALLSLIGKNGCIKVDISS